MQLRDATLGDISIVYALIRMGAHEGLLLKRTKKELRVRIKEHNVIVADTDDTIVGVCVLDFYARRMSELRSLYVLPEYRKRGVGTNLVKAAVKKAKERNVKELLTITTQGLEPWFTTHGFGKYAHQLKIALFRKI